MKKVFTLGLIAAAVIGLASCSTTPKVNTDYFDPEMSAEDVKAKSAELKEEYECKSIKELIKEDALLPPEKGCLVVGSGLEDVYILQQNPKIGYRFYKSTWKMESFLGFGQFRGFCIQPVPVGSEVKLFVGQISNGKYINISYFGIAGVDLKTTKPGVYYLPYNDPECKKEKRALKYAKSVYKGTEWESVIDARIKELKDED